MADPSALNIRTTGEAYAPSEYALAQIASKLTNVGRYAAENLAVSDPDVLATVFDRGISRIDSDKQYLFRLRDDDKTMRAFLSVTNTRRSTIHG